MGDEEHTSIGAWRNALRKELETVDGDLSSMLALAKRERELFHAELRRAIQPRLAAHVQKMPVWTLEQKREVASIISEVASLCNAGVRCPNTGQASRLYADYPVDPARDSRFRLEVVGEDGKRTRTYTSADLPSVDLVPLNSPTTHQGRILRKRPSVDRSR